MFDAKSLLDALLRGGAQPQGQQGGLGDILDQLTRGQQARQGRRSDDPRGEDQGDSDRPEQMGRDEPMLAGPDSLPDEPAAVRGGRPSRHGYDNPAEDREPGPQRGGGLEDMLRDALGGRGGGLGDILGKLQQQGGLADILGQVLGQATSGVREGAGRLDEATGASRLTREQLTQATGRSPEELMAQIKELIANNQLATGAALGGLGTLVLGTSTGRSLAGSVAKLGSLALIGGLAYKAYQNYQQGQPAPAGAAPVRAAALQTAPQGSGFEPGAVSNDQAILLIRAMIAAAAADGRLDATEQQKILGGLKQAGLEAAAQQFLAREVEKPASIDELADAVSSEEQAVQVYTAARVTVDPDQEEEHEFLAELAAALDVSDDLAAHIDATARSAGA
jgi:uncharacterized membrane protein YebE (DUF533 family)